MRYISHYDDKELFKRYVLINLSTQENIEDSLSKIKTNFGIDFFDIYNCGIKEHNIPKLELYDHVPLNLVDLVTPLLYYVDSAESLKNNDIWCKIRDIENDMVINKNGELYSLKELQNREAVRMDKDKIASAEKEPHSLDSLLTEAEAIANNQVPQNQNVDRSYDPER